MIKKFNCNNIEDGNNLNIEDGNNHSSLSVKNFLSTLLSEKNFSISKNQYNLNRIKVFQLLLKIDNENKLEIINELRKLIQEQYNKFSKGQGDLNLSDEQIISIIGMQRQELIFGEQTLGQIKNKFDISNEIITDLNIREFLLKFGFLSQDLGRVVTIKKGSYKKNVTLTMQQIENISKIENEFGLKIPIRREEKDESIIEKYIRGISTIKNIQLSEYELQNVRILHNFGFFTRYPEIKEFKDIKLTSDQVRNISMMKNYLNGIGINLNFYELKHIDKINDLTQEQIEKIKKIKEELGIEISISDIDKINNLTQEQIEKIKKIKEELGIEIAISDIDKINNLTQEQIKKIKKIKEELGIEISISDIDKINDLTQEQIEKIKKIKDSFMKIGIYTTERDIDKIKNLKLRDDQIKNIVEIIPFLDVNILYITAGDIEYIKDIKLTPQQMLNIRRIHDEIGISLLAWDIEYIKDIKLTPQQIINIRRIHDEIGINMLISDIESIKDLKLTSQQILNIKEINRKVWFINPESLKYISKITEKGLEILNIDNGRFYEGYNYSEEEIYLHYFYKKGRIIEKIQTYVQDIIKEDRNLGKYEIIEKIRPDLVTLPVNEKLDIMKQINLIVLKFNTVRKYIDFNKGPYTNPKKLLCAMRGITDPNIIFKITDDITVIQHGFGMHFFVGDEKSYQIIYDLDIKDSGIRTGGFYDPYAKIEELKGILSVGNSRNPGNDINDYGYRTILHEGQHQRNSHWAKDLGSTLCYLPKEDELKLLNAKNEAKKEILAYLRDGREILNIGDGQDTIMNILGKIKSKGGLYQYLKGDLWIKYKNWLKKILRYLSNLIEIATNIGITKGNVISTLADIPVYKWEDLYSVMVKVIKRNKKEGIDLWWTGNEKKENVVKKIKDAKSIEGIKYILNDPRYSHISRGPNNKGGIEISAMIDEVVSGRLSNSYIPKEIRSKVKSFLGH